jgi:hypothetical protein
LSPELLAYAEMSKEDCSLERGIGDEERDGAEAKAMEKK